MHNSTIKILEKKYTPALHKTFVSLCWLLGLLSGYFIATKVSISVLFMMRTSLTERVSIVSVFFATFFPFLLILAVMRYGSALLCLPIVFVKACSFGYCLYTISIAFGSAGWLMRLLYLFSDACCVVVLLLFVFKHPQKRAERYGRELWVCTGVLSAMACIEYFLLSPFAVMLLNY